MQHKTTLFSLAYGRDRSKIAIEDNACIGAMKDRNSIFIHGSNQYAHLVGFKSPEDFVGRSDFDLPCGSVRFAPLFQAQDREVLSSAHPLRILDIHPFRDGQWKALLVDKRLFYEEDGSVGGVFFQCQDVTSEAALHFSLILDHATPSSKDEKVLGQFSYVLGAMRQKPSLTPRQEQILFFLMRRHTLKKISIVLNISLRTVYNEIEKLCLEFGAINKSELIDKAIAAGCASTIPTGLSWCQMSLVLARD
jgi:DNA-binding CsgD family transcriptional regulator